jgi:hypothetical protein
MNKSGLKMVSQPIGEGYVKVTFYTQQEWAERLEVENSMGIRLLENAEVSDVKDVRDGFARKWSNYRQRFDSESSPHTFILEL